MKLYKRFLLVFVAVMMLVALNGCIIIPVSEYYEFSPEEVESVQFYDLRSGEIPRSSGFDKLTDPVFTVAEEDKSAFLEDFSMLEFTDDIVIILAPMDPTFSYGDWVIRINFADGRYTFYSCYAYGETFYADGNRISATSAGCDDEELEKLIRKYY